MFFSMIVCKIVILICNLQPFDGYFRIYLHIQKNCRTFVVAFRKMRVNPRILRPLSAFSCGKRCPLGIRKH